LKKKLIIIIIDPLGHHRGGSATPDRPRGWLNHSHGPRGWFNYPQRPKPIKKIWRVGQTTPMAHEDGSATPKCQNPSNFILFFIIGWPRCPRMVAQPPLFFYFFLFFSFFFFLFFPILLFYYF